LILGTHVDPSATAGERNYLMIATVRLPAEGAELKVDSYDEERGELGGYAGSLAKVEVTMKMNHPTEVNRARYCPKDPFLIATKTASPVVLVYDYSKHDSMPKDDKVTPLLRLSGHEKEGYGIAWSPTQAARLLSGSDDGLVCAWDVAAAKAAKAAPGAGAAPLLRFRAHGGEVVEDVSWHGEHPHIFGSVGDDKSLRVWDSRELGAGGGVGAAAADASPKAVTERAHAGSVMAIAFHPTKDFLLATGGTDKVVRLWDLRAMAKPTHTMVSHVDDVQGLAWSPFSEAHIASSSADRRVIVWDVSRIGEEQDPEDAEDGPPEVMVSGGGGGVWGGWAGGRCSAARKARRAPSQHGAPPHTLLPPAVHPRRPHGPRV
jgi:histone-binding protein RBBP4